MPAPCRALVAAVALLVCLLSPARAGQSVAVVRVVSPAWDSFTNADGTGLYFDLLDAVFRGLYGIDVEHHFVPSLRATHMVRENEADMMVCKARVDPPLVMARMPMYESVYAVFFDAGNVRPWKGRESMAGRSVVWRIGYYDERYIPEGMRTKEVKTGVSALGMVVLGRSDFYLDDPVLIRESIARSELAFDKDRFRIEPVGFRSYHPVLAPTARGRTIMDLYDNGIRTLHDQGALEAIYAKWGHAVPDFGKFR
jgi:ABC-type amino acid transport substrate-binding protein